MRGVRKGAGSGLLSRTGESAVSVVFRGGVGEEPCCESWKDEAAEQIHQD